MSGKYPLIEDTAKTRARKTLSLGTGTVNELSTSDYKTLSAIFPSSPIYSETNDTYRVTAKKYLSPTVDDGLQEGDANQFPEKVDLNYTEAPKFIDGIKSNDGEQFDSPYYPNLIVNTDPAGGPGQKTGIPLEPNDNFGIGNPTSPDTGPSVSSGLLSQTDTISKTTVGTVAGQSFAHSAFPGALNPKTSP